MRLPVLACLILLLTACGPSAEERAAAAAAAAAQRVEAEAAENLREYEAKLAEGNIELAAAYGDLIQARYPQTAAAQAIADSFPEVKAQALALREQRRLAALWTYQTAPMQGGTQRTAVIYSADEGPRVRLVLRRHSSWGLSVFLLPESDIFRCSRCQVPVGLDEAERRWAATKASDAQNPALFIDDKVRFLDAIEDAGELRIRVPVDGGERELVFEVAGYDPARFEAGG